MANETPPDNTTPPASKTLGQAVWSNFSPEEIAKVVITLDNAASSMLKQFGQGQAMADILRSSMATAVTDVRRLGGDIADVLKTQQDASSALGRNVILSNEASKDLYATMKVTGQDVTKIVGGMADVGISSFKATTEMKKVVDVARESGVNAQAVSGKVLDNMQALNKYNFEGGVGGLAKMAAQATALRIDMSQTLGFAEKVFNPEGAIEVAAAMQRLGVSQSALLDPLKLMDLSQNDPAELQNQIAQMSKQFVQLGKDGHFEIMPGAKRQLREISSAMGISYDQLTKMALGSADLDKKLKEITFPDTFSEEQKTMIANMAEMGTGGSYQIKMEDGSMKDVDKLSGPELEAIEKMANTAPPTMEEYAKQQLSATQSITAAINSLADRTGLGLAASKTVGKTLSGVRAVATKGSEIPSEGLEAKNLAKGIDKVMNTFTKATEEYARTGQSSVDLGTILSDFGGFVKNEFTQSFLNAKTKVDELNSEFPLLGNIVKSMQVATGNVLPTSTNTNIPVGGMSTNSVTGSQSSNNPSKVELTHNLNVKVDSNSQNFDIKQAEAIFKSPEFMEKMVVSIKDGLSKMIPGKNESLSAPGIR
jgi:hypothetical protein